MQTKMITLVFVLFYGVVFGQDPIQVPVNQSALVTKWTATWCPICGSTAWATQKKFHEELGKTALVLAVHPSETSTLYSPTAKTLLNNFDLAVSQPTFFYNTTRIGTGGTTTENTITTQVFNAAKETPTAQTGLIATYASGSKELVVQARTEFFKSVEGEFTVSFLLLEDSVLASQSGRSGTELHRNVLRTSLIPEVYGQRLASGGIAQGTFVTNRISYLVPSNLNAAKLRVAAVIWKKNGAKYTFVNVQMVPVTMQAVTTSTHTLHALETFEIRPNLVAESATIHLVVSEQLPQAVVEVFDVFGRPVSTLFVGALSTGIQTFYLDRSDFKAAGTYQLRVRSGNKQAIRPFIVY